MAAGGVAEFDYDLYKKCMVSIGKTGALRALKKLGTEIDAFAHYVYAKRGDRVRDYYEHSFAILAAQTDKEPAADIFPDVKTESQVVKTRNIFKH